MWRDPQIAIGMQVAIALLTSWSLVGIACCLLRSRLLDIPNARSCHQAPRPRSGGIGFALTFFVITGLWGATWPGMAAGIRVDFLLCLLLLSISGLIEDVWGASIKTRLLLQLTAAGFAVLVFPPHYIVNISPFALLAVAIGVVLALVAYVNLYNFMDGMDGLLAGCVAVQLTFWGLYFHQPVPILLVAALAGFLLWNWAPARVFMGDFGSSFLGAYCAISILTAQQWRDSLLMMASTLTIIGDAGYTLTRRLLRGENIFQAHSSHVYQRLYHAGWSHSRVASAHVVLTAVMCLCAARNPDWALPCCITIEGIWLLSAEFYLNVWTALKEK